MKFHAIDELWVQDDESDYYLALLAALKAQGICIPRGSSATVDGFQSPNLLALGHPGVNARVEALRARVAAHLGLPCTVYWVHLVDYEVGGFQKPHDHAHNEDYSCILYLDSGSAGTTFHLNAKRQLKTTVAQERNKLCVFLSQLIHEGAVVETSKRVLVLGLRLADARRQLATA